MCVSKITGLVVLVLFISFAPEYIQGAVVPTTDVLINENEILYENLKNVLDLHRDEKILTLKNLLLKAIEKTEGELSQNANNKIINTADSIFSKYKNSWNEEENVIKISKEIAKAVRNILSGALDNPIVEQIGTIEFEQLLLKNINSNEHSLSSRQALKFFIVNFLLATKNDTHTDDRIKLNIAIDGIIHKYSLKKQLNEIVKEVNKAAYQIFMLIDVLKDLKLFIKNDLNKEEFLLTAVDNIINTMLNRYPNMPKLQKLFLEHYILHILLKNNFHYKGSQGINYYDISQQIIEYTTLNFNKSFQLDLSNTNSRLDNFEINFALFEINLLTNISTSFKNAGQMRITLRNKIKLLEMFTDYIYEFNLDFFKLGIKRPQLKTKIRNFLISSKKIGQPMNYYEVENKIANYLLTKIGSHQLQNTKRLLLEQLLYMEDHSEIFQSYGFLENLNNIKVPDSTVTKPEQIDGATVLLTEKITPSSEVSISTEKVIIDVTPNSSDPESSTDDKKPEIDGDSGTTEQASINDDTSTNSSDGTSSPSDPKTPDTEAITMDPKKNDDDSETKEESITKEETGATTTASNKSDDDSIGTEQPSKNEETIPTETDATKKSTITPATFDEKTEATPTEPKKNDDGSVTKEESIIKEETGATTTASNKSDDDSIGTEQPSKNEETIPTETDATKKSTITPATVDGKTESTPTEPKKNDDETATKEESITKDETGATTMKTIQDDDDSIGKEQPPTNEKINTTVVDATEKTSVTETSTADEKSEAIADDSKKNDDETATKEESIIKKETGATTTESSKSDKDSVGVEQPSKEEEKIPTESDATEKITIIPAKVDEKTEATADDSKKNDDESSTKEESMTKEEKGATTMKPIQDNDDSIGKEKKSGAAADDSKKNDDETATKESIAKEETGATTAESSKSGNDSVAAEQPSKKEETIPTESDATKKSTITPATVDEKTEATPTEPKKNDDGSVIKEESMTKEETGATTLKPIKDDGDSIGKEEPSANEEMITTAGDATEKTSVTEISTADEKPGAAADDSKKSDDESATKEESITKEETTMEPIKTDGDSIVKEESPTNEEIFTAGSDAKDKTMMESLKTQLNITADLHVTASNVDIIFKNVIIRAIGNGTTNGR